METASTFTATKTALYNKCLQPTLAKPRAGLKLFVGRLCVTQHY